MTILFRIMPLPFWCYVIPMLGTSAGLWPSSSPLYTWCSRQLLPVALALLLLGTDLHGMRRAGRHAIGLLWIGALGVMLGTLLALRLWGRWLPADAWQGLAVLAATWTGGSMNFLAVKEALGLSDTAVAPLMITDSCVTYGWMALLLAGARRTPSPASGVPRPDPSTGRVPRLASPQRPIPWLGSRVWVVVLVAIGLSLGAQHVAGRLPSAAGLTTMTWTVLLVTTAALGLSLTPLGRAGRTEPLPKLGGVLLLVLLASIGARANLRGILQAPIFLLAGATAVLTHALLLGLAGLMVRAPRGLLATVSQANLGGVISAPMVAAAYDARLVPVALVLAVIGNLVGTYVGLLTAFLGRLLLP